MHEGAVLVMPNQWKYNSVSLRHSVYEKLTRLSTVVVPGLILSRAMTLDKLIHDRWDKEHPTPEDKKRGEERLQIITDRLFKAKEQRAKEKNEKQYTTKGENNGK
jgi:hypothetical protein